MEPTRLARAIPASPTLALSARAKELRAAGEDVVNLTAGEPDCPTPERLVEAALRAVREGRGGYTPGGGLPDLRAAAAASLAASAGIDRGPKGTVITSGAKSALTFGMMAVAERGARILVLCPYWPSYTAIVTAAGAEPVLVPGAGDRPDLDALEEAAAGEGVVGVLVNSPNNPGGSVLAAEEVERLVGIACRHDLWILSDEIYGHLTFDGATHVSPASIPEGADRTIVVDGTSKRWAMTGWRIGFLSAPPDIAAAVARLQGQMTGCPPAPSQWAALEALTGNGEEDRVMAESFAERRILMTEALAGLPGVTCPRPQGAFYALPDISEAFGPDDEAAAEALLADHRLAVIPGSFSGAPGTIRLSFAAGPDDILEGVARLESALAAKTA